MMDKKIINERWKEIRNAGYDEYDDEYKSNLNYGLEVQCFIDGGQWADRNPNDDIIKKFIRLFYDANKAIHLKYGGWANNMPGLEELEKEQIQYIKENWNSKN